MTTTEILKAIQKQLQHDFETVQDFIESQGSTCEIEIQFSGTVYFYIEYQPSEKAVEELQILKVSQWEGVGKGIKKVWNPSYTMPATVSFIQGAFPLLYAERFSEVCEIEAENEAEEDAIEREIAAGKAEDDFRMSHMEY